MPRLRPARRPHRFPDPHEGVQEQERGDDPRTIEAGHGYERTYTSPPEKGRFPSGFHSADTRFRKNGLRTITNTGCCGLILFPTDVPPGPSTTEYMGRIVYTATPTNDFTIKSTRAREIDVCALLSKKPRSEVEWRAGAAPAECRACPVPC